MFKSNTFGRIFWVDDNLELKSCPLKVDNTGDFEQEDYVSEWTDLEGLELDKLLNIYKTELFNKVNYGVISSIPYLGLGAVCACFSSSSSCRFFLGT